MWAIPDEILARAPESPWGFPVALFAPPAVPADTASRRRALEALPTGGSVLDVGVGVGAASFGLAPPASRVVGVDQSPTMLDRFATEAAGRGVQAQTVEGEWPEVATLAGQADVVICHHVFYNVANLVPFVTALTSAATQRVVVELTAEHPQVGLNSLWRHFHDLERPDGPNFGDAVEVLRELGVEPGIERFTGPARLEDVAREEVVAFARRRLCLPARCDPEVDRLLPPGAGLPGRELVCLWWPVSSLGGSA
jgi:SAM-dependent methyltransferase